MFRVMRRKGLSNHDLHNFFYNYPYASFMNAQLPLLKMALYFDKLVLDSVGASWASIGEEQA